MCSVVGATTIATGLLSFSVIIFVHCKAMSGIDVHITAVEARAWLDANISAAIICYPGQLFAWLVAGLHMCQFLSVSCRLGCSNTGGTHCGQEHC